MTTSENIKNAIPKSVDAELLEARGVNYTSWDEDDANCSHWNNCVSFLFTHKEVKNPFWITLFAGANKISNNETFVKPSIEPTIKDGCLDEIVLYENHKNLYEAQGADYIKEIVESFDTLWFTEDEDLENTPLTYNDPDALYKVAKAITSENVLNVNVKINKNKPTIEKIEELETAVKEARELYNKYQSKERCNYVYNSQNAPKELLKIMRNDHIEHILCEQQILSPDYMPTTATVVTMYGNSPITREFVYDADEGFKEYYGEGFFCGEQIASYFEISKDEANKIFIYIESIKDLVF